MDGCLSVILDCCVSLLSSSKVRLSVGTTVLLVAFMLFSMKSRSGILVGLVAGNWQK